MKLILTGATGFIGPPTSKELQKSHTIIPLSSKECNITHRKDTIRTFSKIKDADCILHMAGTADLKDSYKNPEKQFEINVNGTKNILDACLKNNIPWIIYTSTAAVYSAQGIINETDETKPKSPYGQSKYEAECLIKKYCEEQGMNYTILRYFNIYGTCDTTKNRHIIPSICKSMYQNNHVKITSTGEQTRDFINIKDIAQINSIILDKKIRNKTINIGTGKGATINQIIAIIEKELKTKSKIEYTSKDIPSDTFIADISKLKRLIGKYTFMDIDCGIAEYVRWFLDRNGDI